jgi:hypothetical protein
MTWSNSLRSFLSPGCLGNVNFAYTQGMLAGARTTLSRVLSLFIQLREETGPGRPVGEIVNSPARPNKKLSMTVSIALAICVILMESLTVAGAVRQPTKHPDLLVLRSVSSFSMYILTVNLGQRGSVRIKACENLDQFENCREPWDTSQRLLSKEELMMFKKLSQEADLFGGRANGGHLDLAFRSLEVHARNDVAILVTSLNDSFGTPGPRKELLQRLQKLDSEMAASASKRPSRK